MSASISIAMSRSASRTRAQYVVLAAVSALTAADVEGDSDVEAETLIRALEEEMPEEVRSQPCAVLITRPHYTH